jgi:hypothetical protein
LQTLAGREPMAGGEALCVLLGRNGQREAAGYLEGWLRARGGWAAWAGSAARSRAFVRFARVRLISKGEPIILIRDGRLIEAHLRRELLTRNDLEEEARQQQLPSSSSYNPLACPGTG